MCTFLYFIETDFFFVCSRFGVRTFSSNNMHINCRRRSPKQRHRVDTKKVDQVLRKLYLSSRKSAVKDYCCWIDNSVFFENKSAWIRWPWSEMDNCKSILFGRSCNENPSLSRHQLMSFIILSHCALVFVYGKCRYKYGSGRTIGTND